MHIQCRQVLPSLLPLELNVRTTSLQTTSTTMNKPAERWQQIKTQYRYFWMLSPRGGTPGRVECDLKGNGILIHPRKLLLDQTKQERMQRQTAKNITSCAGDPSDNLVRKVQNKITHISADSSTTNKKAYTIHIDLCFAREMMLVAHASQGLQDIHLLSNLYIWALRRKFWNRGAGENHARARTPQNKRNI